MAKLENFIENYLKNKKISDYEGWLALYGTDATEAYQSAKADADTAYRQAKAEHGARASSLYGRGLAVSGYSDYLNHTAYAERQRSLDLADKERKKTEQANRKGYLSYVQAQADEEAAEAETQKKQTDKIFSDLLSQKIVNEEAAVTYLKARGIDEERAKTMAKESIGILKSSKAFRDQLISEATELHMDYNNAYNYALLKGLAEEDAREVANIAAFATRQRRSHSYYYYY